MTHPSAIHSEADVREWLDANATAPRVTESAVNAAIDREDYLTHGVTTICVLTLTNGYKVIGHSTPASEENFNPDVGRFYARENAKRQIWPLLGFAIKCQEKAVV